MDKLLAEFTHTANVPWVIAKVGMDAKVVLLFEQVTPSITCLRFNLNFCGCFQHCFATSNVSSPQLNNAHLTNGLKLTYIMKHV